MSHKGSVILSVVLAAYAIFVLLFGLHHRRSLHAAEPTKVYEIWHDDTLKLYRVQDGDCNLYIVRGYTNFSAIGAQPAITTAQGCRQ